MIENFNDFTNVKYKIAIFGFDRNRKYLAQFFPNIEFDFFSNLDSLLHNSNSILSNHNYLILRLSGENPQSIMRKIELLKNKDIAKKIIIWTQDNHHQLVTTEVYDYFFKIYVAHPKFYKQKQFPNISHLPCCFAAEDLDKVYKFNNHDFQNKYDVSSSFMLYQGYERNYDFFRIAKIMKKNHLKYALGRTSNLNGEISNYLQLMLQSKVILNITLKGELNMRFFESQVLNRTILMDEINGLESLNLDLRNTFFFKRDLSNFEEVLNQAIGHSTVPVYEHYLLNHTMLNRLSRIIQDLTEITPHEIEITSKKGADMKILPVRIRKYSNFTLYLASLRIKNRYVKALFIYIINFLTFEY
jgi:hypothetical protein